MGILLGFPLAGHFDLLGSDSLFGKSQDPPMYAHTSFSQGRFHQRGQWVEYQLEYQLAPLPLDFQGAFLHVCGWRSPALNMRTMWAEPSFLLLRSTLFVLECQCTDNSRLLLAPEVHLSPASSSGLLQIAVVRSPSCVRLYVTQCTAVHPSSHLILCCPLPPSVFPCIKVFSSELALHIMWPKYWSFSFSTVLPVNIQN